MVSTQSNITHLQVDTTKYNKYRKFILTLCPVMNEVHPPLQRYSLFIPQLEYRIPEGPRRFLARRRVTLSLRRREHTSIEECRQVDPVPVRHRPHRSHHATEAMILYGRNQVQHFVGSLRVRQFCGMTGGEEGKFADGAFTSRTHDVEQSEPISVVQLKRCVEWFSRFQLSVAREVS